MEQSDFSVTRRVEKSGDSSDDSKAKSTYYLNRKDYTDAKDKTARAGDRGKTATFTAGWCQRSPAQGRAQGSRGRGKVAVCEQMY